MKGFTRLDGRKYSDLRPIYVRLNPLKSGHSCSISVGASSAECAGSGAATSVTSILFFAPDNKGRNTAGSYHKPTFEVYVRPATGTVSNSIRGMECVLMKTLQRLVYTDTLGKTLISMRIQVLEDGGGLLAVCLNAVITCALLAGLKLREIPYAVSFGIITHEGNEKLLLDPTAEELRTYCSGGVTVLCEPKTGDISLTTIDHGRGGISANLHAQMQDIAKLAARIGLKYTDDLYKRAFNPARITFEANVS